MNCLAMTNLIRIWRAGVSTALSLAVLLAVSPCCAKGTGTSFGTNLLSTTYYTPDGMYVDLFMHCTSWTSSAPLNSEGMPTGPAYCVMDMLGYPSGIYQFYGKGKFNVAFQGTSLSAWPLNGTIPGSQQTVNGITTALIQVTTLPAGLGTWPQSRQTGLICDLTPLDPNDPPTEFHLIMPGYAAWPNTNATFTNEYLKAVEPFTCFRMMQWMGSNGSAVTTWASRPQPKVWGFNQKGTAYERIIELANTTKRDIWINIPLHATDDWAIGMAQLLKANLKPGLHVYI